MAHHKLIPAFSFVALFAFAASQKPDLVVEVFRHGARGPLNATFDPDSTYWGDAGHLGQLTATGMRMHYILGAAMQNQYPELLAQYDPDLIYVRSTDVNRTIMSGYSHMYGVFGETGPDLTGVDPAKAIPAYQNPGSSNFVTTLAGSLSNGAALPDNYQVVPIHVVPAAQDIILASYSACPMATDWSDSNAEDSESMDVFHNDMNDVVTYLKGQGLPVQTFKDLYYAGDNAVANLYQEIPLPGNIDPTSQYYKDLKFAFEWYTAKLVEGTPLQVELYAVNILDAIADYMNGVNNGTSTLNFVFLSAHDTTLMTMLAAFDLVDEDCLLTNYRSDKAGNGLPDPSCVYPQFASNLIFEFYNTTDPYVVFYYNGLPVSFCGTTSNTCSFSQFQSYITKVTNGYTQEDYLEMCEFPDTVMASTLRDYKIVVIGLSVVSFALIVVLSFSS